jgi:hypothetical protein
MQGIDEFAIDAATPVARVMAPDSATAALFCHVAVPAAVRLMLYPWTMTDRPAAAATIA